MTQILSRTVLWLLGGMTLFYASDWAIWRARLSMGGGMGTVEVGILIESPLKNGREEYDWGGEQVVDCSRSLFPHAGEGACWWLARKKTIEEK